MSVKQILYYPNQQLRKQAEQVEEFDNEELQELIVDLRDTVLAYRAHGLAAPQLGINKRVFVIHTEEEPKVFVNPRIVETEGTRKMKEGCLSFPTVEEIVERAEEVTISAQNESGESFIAYCDELEAVAVQHEYDHLDGILFIDRVSNLKKRYMLKKLKKLTKKIKRVL
jgi:peptide deformylase